MSSFSWNFGDAPFVDLPVGAGHPLQRSIMPIVLRRAELWEVAGTAFAIGPQALLTATHTLVENEVLQGDEAHVLYVGGMNHDGTFTGGMLPIERVNANAQTDIALLQVGLPVIDGAMLVVDVLELSFAAPQPDEVCTVLGYTAGTRFDDSPDRARLEVAPTLHASQGEVVELHHAGRDRSFLPFPVFRTTAHIPFQMSGSPIFAGAGTARRVVGVASTGYDVLEGDEPISYGSLLWPAAGLRMTMLGDMGETEVSLLDLAQSGYVKADSSIDQIDVDKNDPRAWRVGLHGS